MNDFYQNLPEKEKHRINSVEVFDEFEEFELKCSHYLLLCASTNDLVGLIESIIPTKTSQEAQLSADHVDLKPIELSPKSMVLSRLVLLVVYFKQFLFKVCVQKSKT